MSNTLWQSAAQTIVNAGQVPIPVNDTLLQLVQTIMDEKEAEFIQIFTKALNHDEISQKSHLEPTRLNDMLNGLMTKGVITGIPSKSSGEVIYRLMPPIPGLFEFTLMRGETGAKEKKLANLFHQLFGELSNMVQGNYDLAMEMFKTARPITRVVPIHQQIDQKIDNIIPHEDIFQIIDKFDTIAVAYCYCRHERELLGHACQVTQEKENCLFFGQTARFVVDYKFGRLISKDQAHAIIEKAKTDGLVHKSFHIRQDIEKDEFAICNCCKCCCGTFQLYYNGASPMHTYTSFLAQCDKDACTGCGLCEEKCPMEAIFLQDETACVHEVKCIGCGVCVEHCPVEAIQLKRTGMREAFVPPGKRAVG
ncbi:MAG: hypothetical protein C0403_09320 [Desulfobacterium sp.]|nr:hypothetical protein [Desulfobacterium sp.]